MEWIIVAVIAGIPSAITSYFTYKLTKRSANKKIEHFKTITEAIEQSQQTLDQKISELGQAEERLNEINEETSGLQRLKEDADKIASELSEILPKHDDDGDGDDSGSQGWTPEEYALHNLMAKIDLYYRLDEFIDFGHFEMPEYLYETSERFAIEIKRIREQQKEMIKDKTAILFPEATTISSDKAYNNRILGGQVKLMLSAFNIECDYLIGKVAPGNFPRTLERIEKLANTIEKSAATFECGFNIDYVELKYEECRLQYQYSLKKKEEQEEQRLIREQMREEQKARQEYEKALAEAEKEERIYREMLERAKEQLAQATDEERLVAEQRIADLEKQLAEAEAKEERAKSMAEQTKKGHVYIISNIGSFGEDVYKIGLTRRLDPMDRVKELGDASVPFTFDVHAMIYSDDAPALEAALHREFSDLRLNAVNYRKEFFNVDLNQIKEAVNEVSDKETEFKMTALAEEYYETRRLRGQRASVA